MPSPPPGLLDASSLIDMARHYHPLDRSGHFRELLQARLEAGSLLLHGKVLEECGEKAGGVALEAFPFLEDAGVVWLRDGDSPLSEQEHRLIRDHFWIRERLAKAVEKGEDSYDRAVEDALETADPHLLLYARAMGCAIITEENPGSKPRGGARFKKIPVIADELGIPWQHCGEYFRDSSDLTLWEGRPS